MHLLLLLMITITANGYAAPEPGYFASYPISFTQKPLCIRHLEHLNLAETNEKYFEKKIRAITAMLDKQPLMSDGLKQKIRYTLKCNHVRKQSHNNVLTVIDFSLPANQKRLWVFSLDSQKLLHQTYVSHGIKSGFLNTFNFSNRHNSKASSLGIYKTERAYYGRYGLALKLVGQERGFNDNAFNRAIVMHGGWYVEEPFIKKYGRPGRSWGCPAIPMSQTKNIIHKIKDNGLFVAYYPYEKWFLKSKYFQCNNHCPRPLTNKLANQLTPPVENRDDILYIEKNNNHRREEFEPIVAISADDYHNIFHQKAPLKRMLRRQLNEKEYIALNKKELSQLVQTMPNKAYFSDKNERTLVFIIPKVKKVRGYWATEMKPIDLGKIDKITFPNESSQSSQDPVEIHFHNHKKATLHSTSQFIRWLGL